MYNFFLTKEQQEILPVNQRSGKARINCDLYVVFSELLCIESQEGFSQQFVLEASWQGSGAT